uniref:Putative secreted protein n=1 Tax=Xenopsylla cheopis TaxID=163159 RepID=A0A6M2DZP3_XENCH
MLLLQLAVVLLAHLLLILPPIEVKQVEHRQLMQRHRQFRLFKKIKLHWQRNMLLGKRRRRVERKHLLLLKVYQNGNKRYCKDS